MIKIRKFVKNEVVFLISAFVTLISTFLVPPSINYVKYIDFHVLMLLFSLMAAVAGMKKIGVFSWTATVMTKKVKSLRSLAIILIMLCFFSSILITNDVALITFVPLTILLIGDKPKSLIYTIVLETVAANLGSMLTPIGNPHNLYVFSHFGISTIEFMKIMLPLFLFSALILALSVLFLPDGEILPNKHQTEKAKISGVIIYGALFLICVLTVLHIIDYLICFILTCAVLLIYDRKIFIKIDYMLLLTFVCFFIFSGNISSISSVKEFVSSLMYGHEAAVSIALCQVISNVPCAVMLSPFTDNYKSLLYGINIGGLGTLIASLASLISFKFYCRTENALKLKYIIVFSVFNFAILTVLSLFRYFFL